MTNGLSSPATTTNGWHALMTNGQVSPALSSLTPLLREPQGGSPLVAGVRSTLPAPAPAPATSYREAETTAPLYWTASTSSAHHDQAAASRWTAGASSVMHSQPTASHWPAGASSASHSQSTAAQWPSGASSVPHSQSTASHWLAGASPAHHDQSAAGNTATVLDDAQGEVVRRLNPKTRNAKPLTHFPGLVTTPSCLHSLPSTTHMKTPNVSHILEAQPHCVNPRYSILTP
jgi:hypothetical protein